MEAEKSHNLLSVNWRPTQTSGIILCKSKDLRTRGTNDIDSSSSFEVWKQGMLRAGKCFSTLIRKKWWNSPSASLFYSGPQYFGWRTPTLGRANYFPEFIDSNAYFIKKYPHRQTQKRRLTKYPATLWSSQVDTWNQPVQVPPVYQVGTHMHLLKPYLISTWRQQQGYNSV